MDLNKQFFKLDEERKKLKEEEKNKIPRFVTLPNGAIAEMQFDETTEKNIGLYNQRQTLKKLILNYNNDKVISFVKSSDAIAFLEAYKEYLQNTGNVLPHFIFDEFDSEKFEKAIKYLSSGHSLTEVEEYYIRELKSNSNSSKYTFVNRTIFKF